MEVGDRAGPGPTTAKKRRANVGKACNNCRRRKSRCDGQQPECKTCQIYNDECSWGEVEDGRKPASRQYVNTLKNRIAVLEAYLKEKGQQLPSPGPNEGESAAAEEEDEEPGLDGVSTTMLHLHMGEAGEQVHYYGPTSAFAHSSRDPPISASPVEQKTGEFLNQPHDYRRYLPNNVDLSHAQHTVILDRFFRFFASWGMRAMPDLFHQDMIRTVMLPPNMPLARFTHYSPFLHCMILSIALMWADDERLRQNATRAIFAQKAEVYLSVEIARPTLATVQGLALKSSYHSTLGDHTGGWAYFGMADRASLSLGLNLNCTALVDAGRMSKSEMLMRRNAFWCIFVQEQCWSVYIGRPHESQAYSCPLPTVDEQLDEMPWRWDNLDSPDRDLPPQPCMFSTAFVETAKLTVIMQRVMTTLYSIKSDAFKLQKDSTITDLGVALDAWTENLPASLVINGHTLKNALPHILMLQLAKEWCTILIYRPYYRPVAQMTGSQKTTASSESLLNLAVRRCDRSAARINSLLRTYHQRFGLRYSPPTLFNIAFTAGTTHLLSAVRHHGAKIKDTAVADARECVDFLNSVAESWPAAGHKAEILDNLVKEYHPLTQSSTFEQTITLGQGVRRGSGAKAEDTSGNSFVAAEVSPETSTAPAMSGRKSVPAEQKRSTPVGIPLAPQVTEQAHSNPMLATSNQSTGYPSMPWSLLAQSQSNLDDASFAPPQYGMSPPTAPLATNSSTEEYTDPFLYSLLNHITLPPHVPQPANSPGDFTFIPQTGWSPAMPTYHNPNPSMAYDSNAGSASFAQMMSMTSSHEHDRRFSSGSSGLDPPEVRNTQSPVKDMQWNGYFGSG